ncbi:MAG: hypothetical protein NXH75_08880 [Halobacteriovoraceae bacterium]|nr:hypothetical protein [Halobacteriovoraceae bacterium]
MKATILLMTLTLCGFAHATSETFSTQTSIKVTSLKCNLFGSLSGYFQLGGDAGPLRKERLYAKTPGVKCKLAKEIIVNQIINLRNELPAEVTKTTTITSNQTKKWCKTYQADKIKVTVPDLKISYEEAVFELETDEYLISKVRGECK